MQIKAINNSHISKTQIISTSKNSSEVRANNNQSFSYGPFLNISSGTLSNTTITTNSTVLVICHKK